ncbi:hypothetical protein ABZW49_32295 [Nonomuraea wenchangensis]
MGVCKGWIADLGDLVAELSGRDVSEFGDSEVVADDGEGAGVDRVRPETVTVANSSSRRAGGSLRPMLAGLTRA